MARLHYRIPISGNEIYASNLKTSAPNAETGQSSVSGVVHFVLEKFKALFSKTPFQAAAVDIFSPTLEPRFEAVRRTKKALLVEDAEIAESFRSVDPFLMHYEKEIDSDLGAVVSGYKESEIRSEIIYPILFPNHLGEDEAIGYIWVKNQTSTLSRKNVEELHNLSKSIVEEIRKLSDSRIDIRFTIMDISFSGIRLRIHDDLLTTPLFRTQKFIFNIIDPEGNSIAVESILRWWSKESEGLLDLGLEIEEIVGGEPEKNRFIENVNTLRKIKTDSSEENEPVTARLSDSEQRKKQLSLYQNKRILYIDPDTRVVNEVKSLLSDSGYEVIGASSVAEGLDLCVSSYPCLIIVDPNFPNLDAIKFLRALRKISPGSMFIIFSSKGTEDRLIHYLSWIWAYLEKLTSDDMLLESVNEAMDFHSKRMSQFHLSKADEEDLTGEIEWLLWKDYHRNSEQLSLGKNILNNVTHSTSQGLGLGSLLIQLDLAEYFLKEEGEECLVPLEVMNSILENKNVLREWTEKLETIRQLFNLKIVKESISSRAIMDRISETIRSLFKVSEIKKNMIIFTDKVSDYSVLSSLGFLDFCLRELLVNALKFSPPSSRIHVLVHSKRDCLCIDILNEIEIYNGGVSGIPEKFSAKVFEPFSRLNHNYDERFFSVDFGLGIGLNLANHLAERAGAKLSIKEVTDHSGEKQIKRVSAEICLPIVSLGANASPRFSSGTTGKVSFL